MALRLRHGGLAVGLLVASACATATNDNEGGTGAANAGAAGSGTAGAVSGGAHSGGGSGLAGSGSNGASGSPNGAGGSSGGSGPTAGSSGAANAGGGSGGVLVGSAGKSGAGAGGAPAAGAGGALGGAGKTGSGGTLGTAGAVGTAGAPSAGAGAGGGGTTCGSPTTVTLSSVFDAELNAAASTTNLAYVAEANIVRGGSGGSHRAVFWFDFSSVPKGKTLKSATLQITIANNPGLSKSLAVHRISQSSNRAWDETQVTWVAYKSGSDWSSAGGDFMAQASDTQSIADATPAGTVLAFKVLADAQSFYGTPSTNYGWLLKDPLDSTNNSGEHVYIAMRENTTSTPPKLVLTYCP